MIHTKMAVFRGLGKPFEVVEEDFAFDPAASQCLVEVSLGTICGSDLHTVEGRREAPVPCVLGHEGVGRVVALGQGGDPSLLGRRVTWTMTDGCGRCRPCARWELPQKCERLFKYGHAAWSAGSAASGTYASHLLLRPGTTVLTLPDDITDDMAAPANCALATMVAATEPLGSRGDTAVIQGAGLLGLLGCALLREKGWKRVVVVDVNAGRLELVSACGGEPAPDSAAGLVETGSADAVIEASGRPAVIAEGIALLRPGGRYQLVGMVHPESQLGLTGETIIRKCLTLQGIHNYAPRHLQAAVEFLGRRGAALPWDRLVSPPFPLESINEAMSMARSGRWARVSVCPK